MHFYEFVGGKPRDLVRWNINAGLHCKKNRLNMKNHLPKGDRSPHSRIYFKATGAPSGDRGPWRTKPGDESRY